MPRASTIAVHPAGTAAVGFLSAVKDAISTSPAVLPVGAGMETVVVAVSVAAVLELRRAIRGVPAGLRAVRQAPAALAEVPVQSQVAVPVRPAAADA